MSYRLAFLGAVLALSGLVTSARAEGPVVVELFTSQGCSSCPPADEMLGQLTHYDHVLPLAFHVDYWDYIGWEDSFARPEHTARQQRYAAAAGAEFVFTPQIVIGGLDHIVGAKGVEVMETIARHQAVETGVRVTLTEEGSTYVIEASAAAPLPREAFITFVRFDPSETVEVLRGENAGRTLTYHNIVTDMQVLARWDGRSPATMRMPKGRGDAAVLIQYAEAGQMLAAAQAR